MLKGEGGHKNFIDGEICVKPLGILFIGKNKKWKNTKFLFQVCDVEKHTNSYCMNILVRMHNCKRNSDGDKVEIMKTNMWYMEIRRVIHQVAKMLTT